MALRETRASWKRLLFYFLCISIGVGSIVLMRSAIRNFYEVMAADARTILAGDIQVVSGRPWTPEIMRSIDELSKPPEISAKTQTVEAATMLRPADSAREGAMMVDLKGVEPAFPFYGEVLLANGQRYSSGLLQDHGILVGQAVLDRLDLKIGDRVKIGTLICQIRGVVERDPGSGIGFRYGPRVLMDFNTVEQAGLTGFGSRARRSILFKAGPNVNIDQLGERFRDSIKSNLVRIKTYKTSQDNINEQYARAENFLSLSGLAVLVLGGIGISSVTRVFIDQKRKTIAVLKCLGATGSSVIASYLIQLLSLGISGSFLGIGLAEAGMALIHANFADSLPPGIRYALHPGAMLQGLAVGLLTTLLFSVIPLMRVRHIKPNVLLRDEDTTRRFDWVRWIVTGFVAGGLVLLSSWQAGSLKAGFFFLAGLLGAAAALYIVATLLIRGLRRMKRQLPSFPARHAVNSLHRPGNQTLVIVIGVGLGVFFIVATQSMRQNLLQELDLDRRGRMPNLYLIDIQTDQEKGVRELIRQNTHENVELIPTVRARIYSIDNKVVNVDDPANKRDRGRLGFEYTLTYRDHLERNETVLEGKFWDRSASKEPEISIEESMVGVMGLKVGSTITWDILGRKIASRVTSVRRVDWRNSRTGFFVIFRPGTLEKAPQMLIAALDGPSSSKERAHFQRVLIDRFPNITVIDVVDILEGVSKIVNNISTAISFIGGFVFFSGALILIGSIAMTKFQRIYEAAVLKTLGAKRRVILRILILEYGLLGCVAGLTGAVFGLALSWSVSKYVMEIPWSYSPLLHLLSVLLTALLVIAVGAVSSLDILNRKPLGILRTE